MASFATVSLMRETPEVVERFIDYYRNAGATQILIYWDGPAPDFEQLPPEAILIGCDGEFWSEVPGGRPDALEQRQSVVFRYGLTRCRSDWLLVIDADEFVVGDRPIAGFLDAIPPDFDAVSIPTAEAVWGPGDDIYTPFGSTHFRLKWESHKLWHVLRRVVYGPSSSYMQFGLIGHLAGKEFLRAGRRYSSIRSHAAERDGASITRRAARINPDLSAMYVAHYDAIGLGRWVQKWTQRIDRDTEVGNMSSKRISQMSLVAERLRRGDGEAAFRAFYGLSRRQYAILSALGYAFRRDIFAD